VFLHILDAKTAQYKTGPKNSPVLRTQMAAADAGGGCDTAPFAYFEKK